MKVATLALVLLAFVAVADGRRLLRAGQRAAQEPDTTCGKGFDNLVAGSQEYFKTALEKIWVHPGRSEQSGTFERELACWFAYMTTTGCGGLESQYSSRNKDLTAKCTDVKVGWLDIWNLFTKAEFKWYKQNFPADEVKEEPIDIGASAEETGTKELEAEAEPAEAEPAAAAAAETVVNYKQAMHTMKELNKKELLCLTLFTIDDECVKHQYIRVARL